MFRKVLLFSSKNLPYLIPATIVLGLMAGLFFNTSVLKALILPITVIMIYPTMIGFDLRELAHIHEKKLLSLAFFINFILVPAVAYFLGRGLLFGMPGLFVGIAISSLLPTSNMTIAYTMISGGNVSASIKITIASLVTGALVSPWYLYLMVGRYVPFDVWRTVMTLVIVVFLPLLLGILTFRYLMCRYTISEFNSGIKVLLPGISAWGAVCIVFISVSMESKMIFKGLNVLVVAVLVQVVFYMANYFFAVVGSRLCKLNKQEGYVLVYSTALRNLGISMGLATSVFGSQAALMVSFAFLFQPLAAAWFLKLNEKYIFI